MTWFWAKDVGTWTPDLQSTCVNRHKLNGQGFSSLLGNGVAVTLLEAPSCLDGCHHGKEWRAPSGHEWTGKAVSKWWQSGRTTVQSLNYGSWLIWLIVVTSFLPIFGRQWRSCVAACCPAGLWWNSSVVVRTPVADQLWETKRWNQQNQRDDTQESDECFQSCSEIRLKWVQLREKELSDFRGAETNSGGNHALNGPIYRQCQCRS